MKTRVSVRLISVVTALLATALLAGPAWAVDYPTYITASNPVGWWGMNEGATATTTADLSGAYGAANNQAGVNLDLTYLNPGVNTLPGEAGFVSGGGKSAYLDGGSSSTAYNHSTGPYSGALPGAIYRYESGFSVEVWAKMDGFSGTADSERLIGCREWGFGFVAGTGAPLHFTTFGVQDYFSTTGMPTDGGWHQFGVSWNGSTASFFIDGVAAGSQAGAVGLTGISPTSPNNRINLGSRAVDTQHFKGWMDEAVIWDHTRTAGDFLDSYTAALTTAAPHMTATPGSPINIGNVNLSTPSTVTTVNLASDGDPGTIVTITEATIMTLTGGEGAFVFTNPLPGVTPFGKVAGTSADYGIQLLAQTVPGHYTGKATFKTSFGDFIYDLAADVVAHPGDANLDGVVNFLDYNIVKTNYLSNGVGWTGGDLNDDGVVNFLDYNIVKTHFLHTNAANGFTGVQAVPEPATMSLLVLGGIATLIRRRNHRA